MVGEAEVSAGIKSSSLGGAGVKSDELQRRKRGREEGSGDEGIYENDTQLLGQRVFFSLDRINTKMGTRSLIWTESKGVERKSNKLTSD